MLSHGWFPQGGGHAPFWLSLAQGSLCCTVALLALSVRRPVPDVMVHIPLAVSSRDELIVFAIWLDKKGVRLS